jgi:hypothetical protein
MSLAQTSLEDAYGRSFGGRAPIRESGSSSDAIAQPEFTSLAQKAETSIKSNSETIQNLLKSGSLPLADSSSATRESFRVEEPRRPSAPERVQARERFTERPVPAADEDKLARILRLIEQNKTGYERPAVQDMLLYVFTGVFFLFTLDTFVALGKGMRPTKKKTA